MVKMAPNLRQGRKPTEKARATSLSPIGVARRTSKARPISLRRSTTKQNTQALLNEVSKRRVKQAYPTPDTQSTNIIPDSVPLPAATGIGRSILRDQPDLLDNIMGTP